MSRTRFSHNDLQLIADLQRIRQMAGWTVAEEAEALGLSPQTLRGILFRKDRAGPHALDKVLAFTLHAKVQMGTECPHAIDDLCALAARLLHLHRRWLVDRLWQRVRDDFQSEDELWTFLGVTPDTRQQLPARGDLSPAVLHGIARAYRAETLKLDKEGYRGARWCEETAALAERLLTILHRGD